MFRSLGKSKIAFVLAILFGISLFFFKGGSRYSNFFNSDTVIANVSGTPISTTKFNRAMQLNINQLSNMIGKSISGDEIKTFQIHSIALGSLINNAIFENEYDKINLQIDEKVIAQKTKERVPQLYDSNNKLNELYLTTFLQQQQLKIEDLVQIINFETRDKYFNDAFFRINYPQYFTNKINNFNQHKRKISYVELPLNKVSIDEITQQYSSNIKRELQKYYDENINQYMDKEKRSLEYFIIDKQLLSSAFSPTDFEIQKYYNSNKELYFQNEKRSFIQFNFKTIQEAEKFNLEIQSFNLYEILEYSEQNNIRFNNFENLEKNEILEQIAEPLFNLKIDEQSNIIETSLAKHIVILKSIQNSSQKKFEVVKDEIKTLITNIEANNYYNQILSEISEKILNGESLLNIANIFNFKVENIKNLTQDYKDYDQSKKLFFKNLISDSFSSNKDFVSDVINVNENISYVFNVTDIISASPLPFENIENVILKDWNTLKKIEKIKLVVKENLNNDVYLDELSDKYILNINEILLTKQSNEIPRNFINKIFESEKYQNILSISENKFYVGRISDVIMPNEMHELEPTVIKNDLRASFGEELRKDKTISTNDSLIKAIIEQY